MLVRIFCFGFFLNGAQSICKQNAKIICMSSKQKQINKQNQAIYKMKVQRYYVWTVQHGITFKKVKCIMVYLMDET